MSKGKLGLEFFSDKLMSNINQLTRNKRELYMRSYHRQRLALLHKAAQHRIEHQAHQGMRLHDP